MTKNDEVESDNESDEYDEYDEYNESGSEERGEGSDEDDGGKELDVVDPIHHPVHFFPERPDRPEYISIDPRHHGDFNKDDGPPTRSE